MFARKVVRGPLLLLVLCNCALAATAADLLVGQTVCGLVDTNVNDLVAQPDGTYPSIAALAAANNYKSTLSNGTTNYTYSMVLLSTLGPEKSTTVTQVGSRLARYWYTYYNAAFKTTVSDGAYRRVTAEWDTSWSLVPLRINSSNAFYQTAPACVTLHWDEVETLALQLEGATETRPSGVGGNATLELKARAKSSNGSPKPGVAVTFSVDVTANSGGHEHHDVARPKGTLSTSQGTTDANGEVKVTFTAPEVAGIHSIKATCATCSNSPATKEIQVKVPNMVEMLPDTAKPATYTLVGVTGNHKSNHWFTAKARDTLVSVADAMFKTGWGAVGANDGSLMWGGLFDIKGGWTPSHHEHRMGTEVDLSVTNPRNVTEQQKKNTFRELCRKDNSAFSIQTLWHQDDGYPEHFHMYLDGTGLTSQAGGGPCCARYKTTRVKLDKAGNPVPGKNGKPVQETVMLCTETSSR